MNEKSFLRLGLWFLTTLIVSWLLGGIQVFVVWVASAIFCLWMLSYFFEERKSTGTGSAIIWLGLVFGAVCGILGLGIQKTVIFLFIYLAFVLSLSLWGLYESFAGKSGRVYKTVSLAATKVTRLVDVLLF